MPPDKRQPPTRTLTLLSRGEIEITGRLPWSSNFTFLVDVVDNNGTRTSAVYKPLQGEQELWDFPAEIYKREVAAYVLSVALGWPNIPPVVIRENAPYGVGSLQLFIPSDFEQHFFTLFETEKHDSSFESIAAFDIIANNTDRKSGHCLLGNDGEIYAIDNNLCFHEEPKLRTVIWAYANRPVPSTLLAGIERVAKNLPAELSGLMTAPEIEALVMRMNELIDHPIFPAPTSQQQYPWPLI